MDKPKLTIGSKVFLRHRPPYIKTADPMPMLRPADILEVGDQGVIIDIRPGGYWGVRFTQGAFLMEDQYIAALK